MNLALHEEERSLFPLHIWHRRFGANGRASPAFPGFETTQQESKVFIIPEQNTSVCVYKPPEGMLQSSVNMSVEESGIVLGAGAWVNRSTAYWIPVTNATKRVTKPESQEGRIEDFLEEVYSLVIESRFEEATDRVFDFVDRLLCDGEFLACDEILRRVEVERLTPELMRSFLTITMAAKEKLPSRKALYHKIERRMMEIKGAQKTMRIIGRLA